MKNAKVTKANILADRLMNLSVDVIKLSGRINSNFAGRQIAGQLIRSSTPSGANYEEARSAESRADFVHKLQIVLKELRESIYWLRLISKADLVENQKVDVYIQEATELSNMIAQSIITAKKNKKA